MRILLAVLLVLQAPALWADPVAFIRFHTDAAGAAHVTASKGVDGRTPFAIASLGKTLTAVAVLRLVEQGSLRLDAPITTYLPRTTLAGLRGADRLTVAHLLTMTSGLPDYYTDDYLDLALSDPDRFQRPLAALDFAKDRRPLFAPGRGFDYSNTNYLLLGLILQAVSGQPYALVLRAQVLQPAGMSDAFVFGTRPLPRRFPLGHDGGGHVRSYYQGAGFGDGGVIASARDMLHFYRALLVTRSLLGPSSLRRMLRDGAGQGYGMGIEVSGDIVGHSGGDLGFSSDVRFSRASGRFAILLIASEDADTDWPYQHLTTP